MNTRSDCKHIRTKTAYVIEPDNHEAWRTDASATAQYWCLRTMMASAPDGSYVAPEVCHHERSCFENVSS